MEMEMKTRTKKLWTNVVFRPGVRRTTFKETRRARARRAVRKFVLAN